ncbi:organ-specific protein P4-like [Tripterygium wilfordii]|uniref:organ-specific protein P4-like n=1 Tax=Tripterygium wilfordii TaxID=458696 RepID=UPI0018F7E977|nr:organ-specific protein P4-like [Tripterygium wilfordii]
MRSFIALLSLFLVLSTANAARTSPGDYWKSVMKDQPMPNAIEARVVSSKPNDHKAALDLSGKDFDFDTEIKPNQLLVWRSHHRPSLTPGKKNK